MNHSLETIANVLSRAASQIGTQRPQPPRWTQKDRQEKRIGFAICLMPIFEEAYDTPARANNWLAEYGEEHAWPDFYRRIYQELVPDAKQLNLAEVLQEAARAMPGIIKFREWQDEQDAICGKNNGE